MVLINVFAEIWEHGDMATLKSVGARNTNGQTIRRVANKPTLYPDYLSLSVKLKLNAAEMSVTIPHCTGKLHNYGKYGRSKLNYKVSEL